MTTYLSHEREALGILAIPEFVEMVAEIGCRLYAYQSFVDMFGLEKKDFIPQVNESSRR